MKSDEERAQAQFEYERRHRERILTSPRGKKRAKAFADAYRGLAQGMASKRFLDLETESGQKGVQKFRLLRRFLRPMTVAAEFGPGDFSLARVVAHHVYSLALIDVVDNTKGIKLSKNCTFYQGDGSTVPEGLHDLHLAYSSHIIEHLHPDDVYHHLVSVRNALADGGYYAIFTPNRLSGPHDISKRFVDVAQGLHLKEYTVGEMHRLMVVAGFSKVFCSAGGKGMYVRIPLSYVMTAEYLLEMLPQSWRRSIASFLPVKALLGIIMVGRK